jgi:hypothetical protein
VSGGPSELVLAENATWRIRATGDLYNSGGYWWGSTNVYVNFDVDRDGVPYASGRLYDSGPNDDSFKVEFPNVEWVTPNAIRLYKEPRRAAPSFQIVVRNASNRLAKWILLYGQDVFLVLDLEAAAETVFSSLHWGPSAIDVSGEWQDGTPIPKGQVSVSDEISVIEISITETATRLVPRRR